MAPERPFRARRLAAEPELRQRVEAAERLGISLRRFDGVEPEAVTTYEYDADGRLVRSVTVRQPEWDDEQRAWMLALAEYRAGLCPGGCGYQMRDTRGDANEDCFFVPPPSRCHACDALAIAHDNAKNPRPQAVMWTVARR